jgi:hypothetical protein
MAHAQVPPGGQELKESFTSAGMPHARAAALVDALLKSHREPAADVLETAVSYLLRRGILPDGGPIVSSAVASIARLAKEDAGYLKDIEKRESAIAGAVFWQPTVYEAANSSLQEFFTAAHKEFFTEQGGRRPAQTHPPSPLAASYMRDGIPYATNEELRAFLKTRTRERNQGGITDPNDWFVEKVVSDLPRITTGQDLKRYEMMLGNRSGSITAATQFPIRFSLIPNLHEGKQGLEVYTMALTPEHSGVLRRLQQTTYQSKTGKTNHLPGALAYAIIQASHSDGYGVLLEMQSDHDPRETKGLKIENYPDLLRNALHADLKGQGVQYAIAPAASGIIEQVRRNMEFTDFSPGIKAKIERVYGTSSKPPIGYANWEAVIPATPSSAGWQVFNGEHDKYLVKKL